MILDAFNEFVKIIDMLFHRGVGVLFELEQFVLKEDESGIVLTTVLGLESFPNFQNVFGGIASHICHSVVFEHIHEVVVCQAVLVIPFIDVNLVRLVKIRFSDKNSFAGSGF